MEENRKIEFCLLYFISTPKLAHKALEMFEEEKVPFQYHIRAQGTASSEMMDLLGLGGVEKNILLSMLPKPLADRMLCKLRKQFYLGRPGSGIAFTIPLSGANARIIHMLENMENGKEQATAVYKREEPDMSESNYALIMVMVNQGYSEDVMDAARPAGASGGTVFHSRRVGSGEALKFWGISVQEEREIVMVLAKAEDKLAIMKAIGEKCGMKSPAHGVVMSIPVDGVVGMD